MKIDDEHHLYAYARELGDQTVYVVLNRSDENTTAEIPVTGSQTSFIDWLNPADANLNITDSSRPTISAKMDAKELQADHGVLSIPMTPYEATVLAKKD